MQSLKSLQKQLEKLQKAKNNNKDNDLNKNSPLRKSLKTLTVELEELQKADGQNESTEASNLQTINDAIEKRPILALSKFYKHPLFNADHIHKILKTIPLEEAEDALYFLKKYKLLNESHVDTIINRNPTTAAKLDGDMINANHIDTIVQKDPFAAAEYLKDHPLLNMNHINTIVEKAPRAAKYLKNHPLINSQHIQTILEKDPWATGSYFYHHPQFNENHIDTLIEKNPDSAAEYFANHPLLNERHTQTIMEKDPLAGLHLQHFPQVANKYKGNLSFSNNTEMLRKFRDVVEAHGGTLSAKQLGQLGLNENALKVSHLKDANGNYTTEAIQKHIDSMPKHTYNFSHTTWSGDQRHSDDEQLVFQLNHTPEMIKELRNAGVYGTFAMAHGLSEQSGHPVADNTLGWVRYTKGKDGNIHIDEIQSDLGRGLHGAIRNELENPELTEEQRQRYEDLFSKDKVDKMSDILFKGQHPSKILHEAFLQHLRNNGDVGKQVHVWQAIPKAKIANQRTEILLSSRQMPIAKQVAKMIEQNQSVGVDDLDVITRSALPKKEKLKLLNKHTKDGVLNKEAYKQDLIDHPLVKHVVNYINNNQDKITNEQENGYDIHSIPLNIEHLPVHMKVGYQETPPKMGYEQGSYGSIDTQKESDLHNEPTWQAPLRKSLKSLTAELEKLEKVRFENGTHYPEMKDALNNTPHPTKPHLVAFVARNGQPVWRYNDQLSAQEDNRLRSLAAGGLGNKISKLSGMNQRHVRELVTNLLQNPDRHAISANTDPTKPKDHVELRARHLSNALMGKDGYSIVDHPEGIEIVAPRHSQSTQTKDYATSWVYNTQTKQLKSLRHYPKSVMG